MGAYLNTPKTEKEIDEHENDHYAVVAGGM
jgi:hypothetical protein